MIIRRNTSALRAYNAGRKTVSALSKNLEKLSSGYQINRAADDAAGLCASEKMRAKITELGRCQHNASEGIDLARTADAALQEVNDMLKRARSLCIQAENGTYSDQELAAISDEMNHLFGEIDRISAGSYHNSICLFRGDIGQTYRDEYDEHFYPLGPDELELWGELDSVVTADFDPAERATPATAAFKLDDSIAFDNVDTLEGKSIKIGNVTYHFTSNPTTSYATNRVEIDLRGKDTESALKQLTRSPYSGSSSVAGVSVDKNERTVTLTAVLSDLSETIQADGNTIITEAKDGKGEDANGMRVEGPSSPILQVDGLGSKNNRPEYSESTVTYSLSKITGNLTSDQVNNLKTNTLQIYGSSGTSCSKTIHFGDTAANDTVKITAGMTKKALGNAIAETINKDTRFSATFDGSDLKITYQRSSTASAGYLYVQENRSSTPSGSSGADDAHKWTSARANLNVQITQPATLERGEICTVTIPANLDLTKPFSFQLNGTNYLYYNSDTNPLTTPGYPSTQWSDTVPYANMYDTKGKTADQIRADIINKLSTYAKERNPNATITSNGNTLTIDSSSKPSYSMNLSGALKSVAITVTPYNYGSSTPIGDYVLHGSGTVWGNEKVTVPLALGTDISSLAGKGFTIGSRSFEFVNGAGPGASTSYRDIDISSCPDFNSLAIKIQDTLRAGSTNDYTVSIDTAGNMKISYNRSTSSSTGITVIDGDEGITDGTPVQFEGGTNTNHSQKAIDFSEINEDNLDTLLGKGFRINCATCSGEYINVFFCWTNDGSVPLAFEKKDPVTGEMRAIHNIPVELSKVTSGDKIVQSIVEQVRPSLNHYTDVAVGDPPTTLIAMEKRIGDVRDNAGNLYLGSVETGVEANFRYYVEKKRVLDLPEGDLDELKTAEVNIYVGSDPEPQLIPVHLPYIDLYHLRLRPPERVDLTAGGGQDPADWLGRVDRADVAISSARGTIGADYNRLEHALQDLSNADINLTDSESRIRDADMAELMKEQTKLQILMQSQQSMLAQANQVPQGVLQLLQ